MNTAEEYTTKIDLGHSEANDRILRALARYLTEKQPPYFYLDVGCNAGALLRLAPGGIGVDLSIALTKLARAHDCDVVRADAAKLPFAAETFDVAVLSCVLEQSDRPDDLLSEAMRVARYVIGIEAIPGRSPWGYVGGSGGWIKSIFPLTWYGDRGLYVKQFDEQRVFFEGASNDYKR